MKCAVCGESELSFFARKSDWLFSKCAHCGFIFLDPMPTQADLNQLYGDDRGITEVHYPKAASRKSRAWRRALILSPWTFKKSVLDLGCGGGFMANAFQRFGSRAAGLDINDKAVNYARRNFPRCDFFSSSFHVFNPPDTYDFVYSSELIEHVSELQLYMDLLKRVTRIGSHVYITTPDIGSKNVPPDVVDWDVFSPPHHVQFFDESTLALLFLRHGFTQKRRFPDKKAGLKVLFRRDA